MNLNARTGIYPRMNMPAHAYDPALDETARLLQIVSEPTRLKILTLLERGERSVGDIAREIGVNQPNVSKHLKALAAVQLVARRRAGNTIYYSVKDRKTLRALKKIGIRDAQAFSRSTRGHR